MEDVLLIPFQRLVHEMLKLFSNWTTINLVWLISKFPTDKGVTFKLSMESYWHFRLPTTTKQTSIKQNIPVLTTAAPSQHECMNGLDVMVMWVLLTYNTTPIPKPINIDASLCPPTERDGTLNPKYGFQEKFEHPFSGHDEEGRGGDGRVQQVPEMTIQGMQQPAGGNI